MLGVGILKLMDRFIENILLKKLEQNYLLYIYFYEVFDTEEKKRICNYKKIAAYDWCYQNKLNIRFKLALKKY